MHNYRRFKFLQWNKKLYFIRLFKFHILHRINLDNFVLVNFKTVYIMNLLFVVKEEKQSLKLHSLLQWNWATSFQSLFHTFIHMIHCQFPFISFFFQQRNCTVPDIDWPIRHLFFLSFYAFVKWISFSAGKWIIEKIKRNC